MQCSAVQCIAVQWSGVLCCAVQCSAVEWGRVCGVEWVRESEVDWRRADAIRGEKFQPLLTVIVAAFMYVVL